MSESNDRVFCDPEFARRIIQKEEHAVQEAYDALVGCFTAITRKSGGKSRFCRIYCEDAASEAALKIICSPETFWKNVVSGTWASNKSYLCATCVNYLRDMKKRDPLSKATGILWETNDSNDGVEREYKDIPGLRHEAWHPDDEIRGDPALLGQCVMKTMHTIFGPTEDMRKGVHLAVILLGTRVKVVTLSFKNNKDVPQPQSAFEDAEILIPWRAEECGLRITSQGKTLREAWEECRREAIAGARLDDSLAYRAAAITRDNFYQIIRRWKKTVIGYGDALEEKNKEKPPCWMTMELLFIESRKSGQGEGTGYAID